MNANEALEQVRALAEARNDEVRGTYRTGSRVAEEVIANGQALIPTSSVLAILDAVTPDAPVAVAGTSDRPSRAWVAGRCPACGRRGLFVGNGGYLSCSQSGCPDPGAPHDVLTPATAQSGAES